MPPGADLFQDQVVRQRPTDHSSYLSDMRIDSGLLTAWCRIVEVQVETPGILPHRQEIKSVLLSVPMRKLP